MSQAGIPNLGPLDGLQNVHTPTTYYSCMDISIVSIVFITFKGQMTQKAKNQWFNKNGKNTALLLNNKTHTKILKNWVKLFYNRKTFSELPPTHGDRKILTWIKLLGEYYLWSCLEMCGYTPSSYLILKTRNLSPYPVSGSYKSKDGIKPEWVL